jgi:hypothetical protein
LLTLPFLYSLGPSGFKTGWMALLALVLFLVGGSDPGVSWMAFAGFYFLFLGGMRWIETSRGWIPWFVSSILLLMWLIASGDATSGALSEKALVMAGVSSFLAWWLPTPYRPRFVGSCLLCLALSLWVTHAHPIPMVGCVVVFLVAIYRANRADSGLWIIAPWLLVAFTAWGSEMHPEPLWWGCLLFLIAVVLQPKAALSLHLARGLGLLTLAAWVMTAAWDCGFDMASLFPRQWDRVLSPRFTYALLVAGGGWFLSAFPGISKSSIDSMFEAFHTGFQRLITFEKRVRLWWIGAGGVLWVVFRRIP